MSDAKSRDTAGPRLELSVNRRAATAPAGVFFSARTVGVDVEDPYFDLRYEWRFGDPGYYTRHDTDDLPWGRYFEVDGETVLIEDGSEPEGRQVRFLGNDRNIAFGPHVCHVFERPGEYTITCEARQRGQARLQATIRILIEDPAVYFSGRSTICVSSSGNFADAPVGARRAGSFAEAVRQASQSRAENIRILFRRGEIHPTPAARKQRELGSGKRRRRLHWGAFGSGAPPVFGPHNIFLRALAGGETCAWGLNYEGPYRADDPWGASPVGTGAFFADAKAFTTIWDCGMRGGSNLVTIGRRGTGAVVGNCFGTDWHNYGMFAGRGIDRVGLCGVWLKQNPAAVIGNEGKGEKEPPFYQDHAPFRCSALGGPVAFNLCDLRSVGSWAGYYQPCLRIGRSPNGSGAVIEEAVMDRIRGENGSMLGTGNSGKRAYPRRYLWDKIYLVLMPTGGPVFNPQVSGLHYRNVIVVIPNVPRIGKGHLTRWIERVATRKGVPDQPEIGELGVTLMNSTLVDLRGSHPMEFDLESMAAYGFVRIENNVVYTPNKNDPTDTGDAPLDLAVMWRVTNRGMRYREDPFADVFATPHASAAFYRPLPSSPAFDDAAGSRIAVDDFFGRIRGARTSRGAIDAVS